MEYPVSGTKPLTRDGWYDHCITGQQTFVANTTPEFAKYFFDHALISSLGLGSCINIPLVENGAVLGTVNLLAEEHHFTPEKLAAYEALPPKPPTALPAEMTKGCPVPPILFVKISRGGACVFCKKTQARGCETPALCHKTGATWPSPSPNSNSSSPQPRPDRSRAPPARCPSRSHRSPKPSARWKMIWASPCSTVSHAASRSPTKARPSCAMRGKFWPMSPPPAPPFRKTPPPFRASCRWVSPALSRAMCCPISCNATAAPSRRSN